MTIEAPVATTEVNVAPLPTLAIPESSANLPANSQSVARPQRAKQSRRKSNSIHIAEGESTITASKKDYATELEYLVAEALGSEAIVNARTHFPSLSFHNDPPIPSDTKPVSLHC